MEQKLLQLDYYKLRSYFRENSIKSLEISNLVTLSLNNLAIKYAGDGLLVGKTVKFVLWYTSLFEFENNFNILYVWDICLRFV